jgi:nucleoside-diphosphate-sugar epimerase
MKVFLTGGTGNIGKAVLTNLLAHGHQVTCTVKDAVARSALQTAFPSHPNLTLVDFYLTLSSGPALTQIATGFDCIIHTVHSFADDFHAMEETTLRAFIEAGKTTAAAGRPCHLIATTSTASIGYTGEQEVDETGSTEHPSHLGIWRVPMERLVLDSAEGTFTTAIVRPAWVYGGSHVDQYVRVAKERREVIAPNAHGHFGVVHRDDLAELYRLIMEKRGSGVFHGCESYAVSPDEVLAKVLEVSGAAEITRTEEPMKYVPIYGYFLIGLEGNEKPKPRRSMELGWQPQYALLDAFNRLYLTHGHLRMSAKMHQK